MPLIISVSYIKKFSIIDICSYYHLKNTLLTLECICLLSNLSSFRFYDSYVSLICFFFKSMKYDVKNSTIQIWLKIHEAMWGKLSN